MPDDTKVSILPTALTDLPPDSPWWARWIASNAGQIWKKFTTIILAILGTISLMAEIPGTKELFVGHEHAMHIFDLVVAYSGIILAYVNQQKKAGA
jgi:hypothetical protein